MASSGEPEKKSFCQKVGDEFQSFGKFLWNSETKEVMGRSGQSWGKYILQTVVPSVTQERAQIKQ